MTADEVKRIITRMTGIVDGELRFFFGRKNPTMPNSSLLRYFYFIKPLPDGVCLRFADGRRMDGLRRNTTHIFQQSRETGLNVGIRHHKACHYHSDRKDIR